MLNIIKNLFGQGKLSLTILIATTLLTAPLFAAAGEHADHGTADAHKDAKPVVSDPYMLKTDPVTGDPLGNEPIVIQHDGREIRFANEENQEKFNEKPKAYLHAIDKMMIKQQLPLYPLNTCVISGGKLGDMGDPVEFVYKNQLVRFCCKGCKKDFLKDPAKHLAKIDAAVIAKQQPHYTVKTCVVSGDKLGGDMGEPIEYVVGNRLVRLCCKGCKKQFNKTPLAFLDKIAQASGSDKSDGQAQKDSDADSSSGHGQQGHGQH